MSLIAFMMDDEEGHLFPSFALADALVENGHEVVYLSVADNQQYVEAQGFRFQPIFQDIYPKGYKEVFRNSRLSQINTQPDQPIRNIYDHLATMISPSFAKMIDELQADAFVVSGFLDIEALILYYRYGIEPVIFSPGLWEPNTDLLHSCGLNILQDSGLAIKLVEIISELGIKISRLDDFVKPLYKFHELIACNEELDFREKLISKINVHYIGPSIRKSEAEFELPNDKKIIYASLGSQSALYGDTCINFFKKLLNVMQRPEMQQFFLVLATGKEISLDTPSNVMAHAWVPQTAILREADLAIIHCGLGSVKECIYYGVPILAVPIARDQPLNAKRIVQAGVGHAVRIKSITEDELAQLIISIPCDLSINSNIQQLRAAFHQAEAANTGVQVIESMLAANSIPQ